MDHKWTVLYDGYCNLCSRTVQWIVRNDPNKRFIFKTLQERQTFEQPGMDTEGHSSYDDTVVLMRDEKVYKRSTAVLRIALRLRFPWPLMGIFFLVPRFLRDPIYRVVAGKRKRWFGERTTCYIP